MSSDHTYTTKYTLISRALEQNSEQAWEELIEVYSKFVYFILRELSVPEQDIDDVGQKTLLALTTGLKSYNQDRGRFRSWLRTLIKHEAFAYFRHKKKYEDKTSYIEDTQVETGVVDSEVDQKIEDEWKKYISSLAIERMKKVFKGQAIEVFELGLKGLDTDEIAAVTKLPKGTIYTLRQRMKKSLMKEAKNLIEEIEPI